MEIKLLSLSDEGLADSRKSFKVYVKFLMCKMKKGLAITTPQGSMTLHLPEISMPLFFHKGMVGNLRADPRAITCREVLILEMGRQYAQRVANNHSRIYMTHLRGTFRQGLTDKNLTEFIKDFVHQRDGRHALLDSAIKVELNDNRSGDIVFPTLDTYIGDALTSPSMLVWLLRNGQKFILNTRNNYDNLEGVYNRIKKSWIKVPFPSGKQLLFWLAFFLTPTQENSQVMESEAINWGQVGSPNGPVNYLPQMHIEATMQNILHSDGLINRFAKLTDNFDDAILFRGIPNFEKVKAYEKYIK